MSIDVLQSKMKKANSTLVVDMTVSHIPPRLVEACGDETAACKAFCKQLLTGLKGEVAAVRFQFMHYALRGEKGLGALTYLLKSAAALGFYTILDMNGVASFEQASCAAQLAWGEKPSFPCDAIQIPSFFGCEMIKAFLPYCEDGKKDLFVVVRSPDRSASEIQDLLTGSRMVHMAAADYVNRYGANTVGKSGYCRIAFCASAAMEESLKLLRSRYPQRFILIDGLDYPGASGRKCAAGFDRLGRGAAVCVGASVTSAWEQSGDENQDPVQCAVEAVRKTNKRMENYVRIL